MAAIELTFQIGQHVKIKPLDGMKGRVEGAYLGFGDRLRYDVRYFNNSESKTCYFSADELEPA